MQGMAADSAAASGQPHRIHYAFNRHLDAELMLTLTVTPLRRVTGYSAPVRYRRLLGLFTFFTPACISPPISGWTSSLA